MPACVRAPVVAGTLHAVAAVPTVSVLVPTLDEERRIAATLDHLAALPGRFEVIVADGGSRDATVALARAHPSAPRVVVAPVGGRGAQCNAAAALARGEVLLVLHADSRLPAGAHASLAEAWRAGAAGGNFVLRFDGADVFARGLAVVYALLRRVGIYYGDSSVWLRREAWDALGGVRELPIMDDLDLVRRLERLGSTRCLPGPATTSDRRWRARGIPRTVAAWVVIQVLWWLGVPERRLARLYRAVR